MANRSSRTGRGLRNSTVRKSKSGATLAGRALSKGAPDGSYELKTGAVGAFNRFATPAPGKVDEIDDVDIAQMTALAAVRGANLEIAMRADVVAKALGSRAKLANVLKVSASQPTRWIKGQEAPNSENTRAIVDLEHVVIRARLLWGDDDVVNAWLTGRNGFLDGARPIDVIATQGSGPAIDALDQATAGAFA